MVKKPDLIHPLLASIEGYFFEVASFSELTDFQARRIAENFYRKNSYKLRKKDKGIIIRINSVLNDNISEIL
jgi:hypothetical protein